MPSAFNWKRLPFRRINVTKFDKQKKKKKKKKKEKKKKKKKERKLSGLEIFETVGPDVS